MEPGVGNRTRRIVAAGAVIAGVLAGWPALRAAVTAAARVDASSRPSSSAQPSGAPNIVLILADDLGYGDLASYGHPLIRTPRLDRLAAEGIRLTSYYSGAPACTPARAALLTGRYPQRVGLGSVLMPESKNGIPDGTQTLAEALRARGYRSFMAGKWHLGHARPEMLPTGKGFDGWLGLPYSNDMMPPWVKTSVPLRLHRGASPIDGEVDQSTLTARYTEEAVRFVRDAAAKGPFFLYVAHNMPHLPIHASERFRGKSPAGLYGDVIEELDWSTGAILDALEETRVAGRTIVVFTSDNGPWLNLPARMLQARNEPWHAGSPGLLRGAKGTTWEGGIRVPAIVKWPGVIPPGRVSAGIAAAMDLHVTLVRAAGGTPAPDTDGHDLRRFLAGEAPSPTERFFYVNNGRVEGVREGPWKLRRTGEGGSQLFHLELDPSERYDRAAHEPDVVKRLEGLMASFEH